MGWRIGYAVLIAACLVGIAWALLARRLRRSAWRRTGRSSGQSNVAGRPWWRCPVPAAYFRAFVVLRTGGSSLRRNWPSSFDCQICPVSMSIAVSQ